MYAPPPAGLQTATDWLAYYSSISSVKVSLEDRFVSLTVRQSVGTVAAVTLMGFIRHELSAPRLAALVGSVAGLGVALLGYLASKYFLQIRAIGEIMASIEKNQLQLGSAVGVKLQLCNSRMLSIFTIGRTPFWCVASAFLHTLLVAAVALAIGLGLV